ncbi:YidC/Oxa1 family membrane protein insertase [Clostridium tetanomorphum]|uniref:Membrane protein insertase YidC n=1 Tax=Clostridium tetanomorphum TaxID=1553 RepID=A0A923EBW7_CLOTT|nr:membrane protein insertase YidC [Clostridium tetanomorphum]KAJ49565.1 inner membrane protein translocase component YidC [Clostridium tetanomorphum DSM 665]KAJ50016.1 inner membrane protein translocase component YidC [Clostridium tetanomorphum DSM 665]MBC2399007.1 membrane protein insertase YidC [Clostridium tetanomorphum]MBP1866213.1 YidC/Oxa1 family membrane protein insertase [Clostridium tetanomorphum]NRS86595.1 YidC/Oxa1 family membrane protein insertase [Clostridium tetanomorphum]
MSYLNNALVQFFVYVHKLVASVISNPNYSYGVAIILVTLIIKIVLVPLNIKSIRSSIRMSKIQPEAKKLQDKYKNDPQRAQQEVMKLYKEKGVSPFGGCLPLLIQWPILLALYYVFNNISGINGVTFLWIKDLAKSDIILAVLAGATQYYSGLIMNPPGENPQAKQASAMNLYMSLFMIFISWRLKAALVLYWVVSNIMQMGQTILTKKLEEKHMSESDA